MSDAKTWPEWSHKFTATREIPETLHPHYAHELKTRRVVITVEAGLHFLRGNRAPYFSVTGHTETRPRGRDWLEGGCIHEQVLATWPELAPVVALHLCDIDGVPSHDGGNLRYFLAGALHENGGQRYHFGNSKGHHNGEYRFPTPAECLAVFAKHARISPTEAHNVAALVSTFRDSWPDAWRIFGEWVERQRPRWKTDAESAIALLDTLRAEVPA